MTENPNNLPVIYFITPTYYRPTQKADLTRLVQTLGIIPKTYKIYKTFTIPYNNYNSFIHNFNKTFIICSAPTRFS